jgi:hypothetical protein
MAIKIDDKSLNDLLPPKMDSQLVRPQFMPNDFSAGVISRRNSRARWSFSLVTR